MITINDTYVDIARELCCAYNYYQDVYFDMVFEAVKRCIDDFEGEVKPIEEFHKHIRQNYI